MDLKSVIKTFAEAWAAASLKMEKSNSLPLPPSWESLGKGPSFSNWPTPSPLPNLPFPNLASIRSRDVETDNWTEFTSSMFSRMKQKIEETEMVPQEVRIDQVV